MARPGVLSTTVTVSPGPSRSRVNLARSSRSWASLPRKGTTTSTRGLAITGLSSEAVQDYYEELWQRLPETLDPPEFARRRDFLAAEVRPGDRVLDLGCGAGEFAAIAGELGARVVGVDVAQGALERARRSHPDLDFRLAPLDGPLPIEDNSFDVIWASE